MSQEEEDEKKIAISTHKLHHQSCISIRITCYHSLYVVFEVRDLSFLSSSTFCHHYPSVLMVGRVELSFCPEFKSTSFSLLSTLLLFETSVREKRRRENGKKGVASGKSSKVSSYLSSYSNKVSLRWMTKEKREEEDADVSPKIRRGKDAWEKMEREEADWAEAQIHTSSKDARNNNNFTR